MCGCAVSECWVAQAQGAGVGDPAADRQAFAWLMYDLLAGGGGTGGDARARSKHLRKPAGITRGQWRGLRNALKGEDDACAMLLATFAGNSGPTSGRRSTLGAFERLGRPAWFREWLATGAALLILIAAGFFYLALRSQPTQQVANAATPAGPLEREAVLPPAQPTQPDGAASPAADSSATRTAPANVTAVAMPRIDLPSDAAWVETTQPVARVWVRRRGSLDQAVTFQWWTESGSALPERDFRAVPPRIEMIRAGDKRGRGAGSADSRCDEGRSAHIFRQDRCARSRCHAGFAYVDAGGHRSAGLPGST